MLVEWADPAEGGAAGPHDVDATLGTNGCATCHRAGVHGAGSSNYWGMNAYMLGGGNDTMIAQELPWQNVSYVNTGNVYTDGTGTGINWFANGSSVQTSLGGVPGGNTSTFSAGQWAAQRSLLTGWTCSQTGCHVNSVLGNTNWGQTYNRDQLNTTGTPVAANMMLTTGHSTVLGISDRSSSGAANCGPCHPGSMAGGYRYYANVNATPSGSIYDNKYNLLPATKYALSNSKAYGCDQCHDAIGVATNSTAFPHGNSGIDIYQWQYTGAAYNTTSNNTGDPTDTIVADGTNLWMYQSNMSAWSSNSLTTLVDPSYTLLNNLIDGTGSTTSGIGNIQDSVCLKCHVPYDLASAKAWGSPDATHMLNAGTAHNHGRPTIANVKGYDLTTGFTTTSGKWIYLWR